MFFLTQIFWLINKFWEVVQVTKYKMTLAAKHFIWFQVMLQLYQAAVSLFLYAYEKTCFLSVWLEGAFFLAFAHPKPGAHSKKVI